jgi:hypothetical protein
VWGFRSPHHYFRQFVMRTSEPEATLESGFASVLLNPKFAKEAAAKCGELRIRDTRPG